MNGIGDISNSKIEKIEQQVQYNTVLSEEIREAILLITALIKEDLEWKRQERGKIMWERLTEERRNYSFSIFDKLMRFLLIPAVLVWAFSTWKNIVSPLLKFINENGFSLANFWRGVVLVSESMIKYQSTFFVLVAVTFVYIIITGLSSFCIARHRAKRKYQPEFEAVVKQFNLCE